jgi:broad specificity phosphatase PhoE
MGERMPLRLLLVSQAATAAMREGRFPGDPFAGLPLDSRGFAEAQAICARLPGPAGIRALTSPAQAARDTARALGLDAAPVAALADLGYGRWHGRALKEIARDEPDALAAWCRDPDAAPHGGESFVELVGRVARWLDGLQEEADKEPDEEADVIAVSHAAVLRAALIHVLDAPPASFSRIEIAPLTVLELRRAGRGWTWWPR